jgi:lipoate-protein ligase A
MAVDEAILESVAQKRQPPTLRFYDWQPFALSLGYAQSFADVDVPALQARGWDVVRRPTGGKAILHAEELTYSVCATEDDPHVSGNVIESYRRLSTACCAVLNWQASQPIPNRRIKSNHPQTKIRFVFNTLRITRLLFTAGS